jgi:hypothetical protein
MSFRLHIVKNVLDLAGGADHESSSRDAHHFAAVHVFLFDHPKLVGDLLVGVGEEREWQAVTILKLLLSGGRVARNADQNRTRLFDLLVCVAEPARLNRSARSIGLWVEKENHCFAAKIF